MKRFQISNFKFLIFLACFLWPLAGLAAQPAGVLVVDLVSDGTYTSGADSGTSIYVIDHTAVRNFTGNMMGQFTGVTLTGSDDAPAGTTLWPCAFSTGVSVYYADMAFNPASGASPWSLVNWNLISATGGTIRSGNTYFAFDIPANPAAPYTALKFVWSGASQFAYGFRYGVSVNP